MTTKHKAGTELLILSSYEQTTRRPSTEVMQVNLATMRSVIHAKEMGDTFTLCACLLDGIGGSRS